MSTFSHSQDEERGKQPAREAPGSRAKFRVNGTTARMTIPIPGIRRMADSVTNDTKTRGTWGPEAAKRRSFGITHYTFCSTSLQEESNGDS